MWLIVSLLACILSAHAQAKQVTLHYDGFTITYDCDKRGAIGFEYTATADTGDLPRRRSFYIDNVSPELGPDCPQQFSTRSYRYDGVAYDRGHLVPANHLDHLPLGIQQSNYMTNILPQTRTMNRGAWLRTEEIIECYRDIEDLHVIGGVIWGRNPDDDYFVETHGIRTPDYFWKVVLGSNTAIAWIVPNSPYASRSRLDWYLASIEEIERFTGQTIDAPPELKSILPVRSWPIPRGCDRS